MHHEHKTVLEYLGYPTLLVNRSESPIKNYSYVYSGEEGAWFSDNTYLLPVTHRAGKPPTYM